MSKDGEEEEGRLTIDRDDRGAEDLKNVIVMFLRGRRTHEGTEERKREGKDEGFK